MLQDDRPAPAVAEPDSSTAAALSAFDPAGAVREMDGATSAWHLQLPEAAVPDLPLRLHLCNFELWHLEDEARDPHAEPRQIVAVKRSIDRVNQRRNNTAEAVDEALLRLLAARGLPRPDAPLHSETPGQMLDRLSILSLKQFHTAEQAERTDATAAHRERNRERLAVLRVQSADLLGCLEQVWLAVLCGERRFKLYRQFKMYNDAELNPVLYRNGGAT